MDGLVERLTGRRLALVAAIVVVTGLLLAVGNPLAHPEEGEGASGQRGVSGVPRIVFLAGLAVAFVLALPPGEGPPRSGEGPG